MSNHREPRKRSVIDYRDSEEDDDIDVLTPSEASSDYTDGDSDEVIILSTKEPTPVAATIHIVPHKQSPPYETIRNVDTIHAYLEQRVKDQPTLYNIAATISAAVNRSFSQQQQDKRPRVTKLMIAGVSGCGKTETVLATQALLGIGPGTDCEAQVVFLDGSTLCSESQVNAITGAAAGLVGYRDGHSIADRLNRAINKPTATNKKKLTPFQQQAAIANAATARTKPKKAATTTEVPYVPPRFIMLVIDELDKVSPDLLKAINGLIETGDYATPNHSVCFKKPVETTLFIMFTSNYGAEAIGMMKERDDEMAEEMVVDDMRGCGVPPYTIGRLGDIFPFYPLVDEALHQLLGDRLDMYVQKMPLAQNFSRKITTTNEAKKMLIETVLTKIHSDMGVRGAMKQLQRRVDLLFEKAFSVLSNMPAFSPDNDLQIIGYHFNMCDFDDETKINELSNIIQSIKMNRANTQMIALYRNKKITNIGAIGIKIGEIDLCHFLMPVNIGGTTYINNNNNSVVTTELLELRQTLTSVSQLVNSTAAVTHTVAVMKHIRNVINGIRQEEEPLFLNSSDAVQCESQNGIENKRKADEQHIFDDDQMTKKARITMSYSDTKRGCKAREIEGFTAIEYQPKSKRYLYRCDDCKQSVDSRKIGNHQCI